MYQFQIMTSGKANIAVYQWGQPKTAQDDRQTIVCIHGYPDSGIVWKEFAEHLEDKFHVVAYDVRGSGQSSAPKGTAAYHFDYLVDDLAVVIDRVSPDRPVHLVAYDWGALQAWEAVLDGRLHDRIASYSTAAPSLDHVGHWFHRRLAQPTVSGLSQFAKRAIGSSYMLMIQAPVLPELTWQLGLGRLWPHIVSKLERAPVKSHKQLISDAKSGLGIYRANLMSPLLNPTMRTTNLPVQLLIMRNDPFVPPLMFEGMEEWAPNTQRTEIAAGHWWLSSKPEQVAQHVAQFVTQHGQ